MKNTKMLLIFLAIFFHLSISQPNGERLRVAVGEFRSDLSYYQSQMSAMRNRFQSALVRTNVYKVIELRDRDLIEIQKKFESSQYDEKSKLVSMGRMYDARTIFTGTVDQIGSTYIVTINKYDASTGEVVESQSIDLPGQIDETVLKQIESAAQKFAGTYVEESDYTWYYVGAAVLIGGGAAAAVLGKKKPEEKVIDNNLPDPPSKPN